MALKLSELKALCVVPLVGAALILGGCSGEDRPAVDVVEGPAGAGGATGSVSAEGLDVAGPQPTQIPSSVYNVVSNVDQFFAAGFDLRDTRALLSLAAEGRKVDWAAVTALYEQGKNQKRPDGTTASFAGMADASVYAMFPNGASVYGSPTFLDKTIRDAIAGTGRSAGLTENARRNVIDRTMISIVYGMALQEMEVAKSRLAERNLDPNTGAPRAVDEAYALLAGPLDGSGTRTYSVFGDALKAELTFSINGKVRNPLEAALTDAQRAAIAGDSAAFERAHAMVKGYLNAAVYINVLKYAKTIELQTTALAREGGIPEGWAFWQAIRATVAQASPTAAKTIEDAFTQTSDKPWPATLSASIRAALNDPAVYAALGIPAELQIKQ